MRSFIDTPAFFILTIWDWGIHLTRGTACFVQIPLLQKLQAIGLFRGSEMSVVNIFFIASRMLSFCYSALDIAFSSTCERGTNTEEVSKY